jgi:hypothetical protein
MATYLLNFGAKMTPGCYSFPPISVAPPLRAEKYKASITAISRIGFQTGKNRGELYMINMRSAK